MIADKCVGMDIALVIVNAGVSLTGPFADLNNEEVESMVSTNALHVIYTIKVLLP